MHIINNKKGFTLIEFLIIIAVLGILAVLAMLSLAGSRAQAYDSKILSDIHNIKAALSACANENADSYAACALPAGFAPPPCSPDTAYHFATSTDESKYVIWAASCAQWGKVLCTDYTGFSGIVGLIRRYPSACLQ